jgi:hypothetical protein
MNKLVARSAAVAVAMVSLAAVPGAQDASRPGDAPGVPTFSKDVAPILFEHCTSCHRPGEIAPMSLLTYDAARPYARAIAAAVGNRTMPPWHAEAPRGTFANERLLTDLERRTLVDWAAGGAPNGDAKDLPASPVYTDQWALGRPDVVLEMGEEYRIPARGTIQYEYFYIPTNFTEPRWVQSIEVRPGNREAVHHVLVYYRAKPETNAPRLVRGNPDHAIQERSGPGQRPPRDDLKLPQRLVATYAPGTNPQLAPAGTAFRLEPGGIFELQMHYTATGTEGSDRTRLGIVFSRDPAPRELRAHHFMNARLVLPAGAPDVSVSTDLEFLEDATVWGLFPHTHVRGKKWEYSLKLPDGSTKPILSVPRYDFNWQTYYMFRVPLEVPKGARIVSTAWYDNSPANRNNPDPSVDVKWGDQTWEEMQYTGILVSPVK